VELRLLRVDHWGLDGRVHRGELIVHRDHARRILGGAFAAAGWRWGGNWSGSRDYQHFSSTGR
jgi:hypothetical protein